MADLSFFNTNVNLTLLNFVFLQGGRELEDFIKYIAKHSTDGLKNYDRNGKLIKEEL